MDMTRESKFTFGKYKGRTLQTVIENDPKYVLWASAAIDWFNVSEDIMDIIKADPPGKHRLYIYRVRSSDGLEKFYKIGVSSQRKLGNRFSLEYENSMAKHYKRSFFKYFEFSSRQMAELAEQKLHEGMTSFKYTPEHKFGGYTECYGRSQTATKHLRKLIGILGMSYVRDSNSSKSRNKEKWNAFRKTIDFELTKNNPKIMSQKYKKFKETLNY